MKKRNNKIKQSKGDNPTATQTNRGPEGRGRTTERDIEESESGIRER
jgi:hypothetical protein